MSTPNELAAVIEQANWAYYKTFRDNGHSHNTICTGHDVLTRKYFNRFKDRYEKENK